MVLSHVIIPVVIRCTSICMPCSIRRNVSIMWSYSTICMFRRISVGMAIISRPILCLRISPRWRWMVPTGSRLRHSSRFFIVCFIDVSIYSRWIFFFGSSSVIIPLLITFRALIYPDLIFFINMYWRFTLASFTAITTTSFTSTTTATAWTTRTSRMARSNTSCISITFTTRE